MCNLQFWVGLVVGIVAWGFSKVRERRAVRRFLPQFLRPRPDTRQQVLERIDESLNMLSEDIRYIFREELQSRPAGRPARRQAFDY